MLLQQLNQWEFTSSNEWGVRSTVLECFTNLHGLSCLSKVSWVRSFEELAQLRKHNLMLGFRGMNPFRLHSFRLDLFFSSLTRANQLSLFQVGKEAGQASIFWILSNLSALVSRFESTINRFISELLDSTSQSSGLRINLRIGSRSRDQD